MRRRQVLLPGRSRRRHLLASLDFRDDPKLATRPGDVARPWQDLVEEIQQSDAPTAVISHEFFGPAAVEQIRRGVEQLAPAEVHVALTARPMTELAPSQWQEWVKNGGRKPIDEFPPRDDYSPHDAWGWGAFDLGDVLARWSQAVPAERIHVLPMGARGAEPGEIWRRFIDLLGVPGPELAAPEKPVNQRLGLVQVEALRKINQKLKGFSSGYDRGAWIRGYLGSAPVMPAGSERFRPAPETWAGWVERGESAVAMLRTDDYDVRGDVDALMPRREQPDVRHPDEVSADELLEVTSEMVSTMLTDVRSRNRERHSLRERLRNAEASSMRPQPSAPARLVRRVRGVLGR
ncbi:hypothetical protein [Nocardioides dubius]|uniref:hypothetical protein n=1 Tax=Nocardioides dubius TaxID=317019 RepID=UPI0031D17361